MHIAHRSTLLNCTIGCHRRNRYFHEWLGTSTHTNGIQGFASNWINLPCNRRNWCRVECGQWRMPRASRTPSLSLQSSWISICLTRRTPPAIFREFLDSCHSTRVSACKFVALARQLDSARITTLALENKFHFLSFFIADILSCFYCVYIFKSIFPSALCWYFFSGYSFSCIIPS